MDQFVKYEPDPRYDIKVRGHWEIGLVDLHQGEGYVSVVTSEIPKLIHALQTCLDEMDALDRQVEEDNRAYEAYLGDPLRIAEEQWGPL